MDKEFSLSLSNTQKGLSYFLLLLPVLFLGIAFAEGESAILLVAVIVFCLMFVMYLFAPVKYIVSPDSVTIWRFGPKIVIPKSQIDSVEPIVLRNAIRTCGVGGFFGSYGWFYSSQLGSFRAYVTRSDNLVVLRLADQKPVVLSPDDLGGFVDAVRSRS